MNTCFGPADILLPRDEETAALWPVVACDQFTSQRDYWEKAATLVGEKPSALHIVFPEVYLEDGFDRIESIQQHIESYLKEGVLTEKVHQGYVLVERLTQSGARIGLVGMVDLDCYDYTPESKALIRATEGTVTSRIPPRVRIREGAQVESPHVMLLCDDRQRELIEPHDYVPNAAQMEKTKARIYALFNTNEKIVNSNWTESEWAAYFEAEIEPVLLDMQNEFTRKLFSRRERAAGNRIIFDAGGIDSETTTTKLSYVQMVNRRSMTPNEWREKFHMAPIEGGDKPYDWQNPGNTLKGGETE